jgi:sodium-dependent dicarboxylate transporter 2/3/5
MANTKKINSATIKWLILIAIVVILALLPTNESFTGTIKAFICITIGGIGMIALGLFDSPLIPSLLMMFGYLTFMDLSVIMRGWAKDAPWIILSIFIIIAVVNKTPLLRRIAFHIMVLTGGSYVGVCVGFYIAGFLLSFLGDSPCSALIAISFGVVVSLNLKNKKAAAGIMLCAFHGIMEAGLFIFSPSVGSFLYGTAASASELVTPGGYGEWFVGGLIFVPYYIIILIVTILMFKPKEGFGENPKEYFKGELQKLGKMSRDEIKLSIILVGMFVYLLTNTLHHQKMIFGFVFAACLLFFPGIKLGDKNDIKNVNFSFPIFIVACLAIGEVATELGVGELLADVLVPILNGGNPFIYLFLIALVCFLLNFVMTPMAVFSTLLVPLTMVTMAMPSFTNIFPLFAAILTGVGNLLLPHETTNSLVLFGFDAMSMKDFVKGFGVKAILGFAWLFIAVLYWQAIGYIV